MSDREEQKPLKKVEHIINDTKLSLIQGVSFGLNRVSKVNKEELVNNVRLNMSESAGQVGWDGKGEQTARPDWGGRQDENEGEDDDGLIRDEDQEDESDNKNYDLREQKAQQQNYDSKVEQSQLKRRMEEQEQQIKWEQQDGEYGGYNQENRLQEVLSGIPNQPQSSHPPLNQTQKQHQQQKPIQQKHTLSIPSPIPQEYNKIKYTYNQMHDEEIALSSASIIISQHVVMSTEDPPTFYQRQQNQRQSRPKQQNVSKEQHALKDQTTQQGDIKKATSLEEIRSSHGVQNKLQDERKTERQRLKTSQCQENQLKGREQPARDKPLQIQINLNQQGCPSPQNQSRSSRTQKHQQNASYQSSSSQKSSPSQNSSQQQQQTHIDFDLQRYKSVEPILEEILVQLKNLLKNVKSDTINYDKNGRHSKFFNAQSDSKNKPNRNHSLLDIVQRRKHHLYHAGGTRSTKPDDPKIMHNMTHQQITIKDKDQIRVGLEGNRSKPVPYGLGSLGNPIDANHLQRALNHQSASPGLQQPDSVSHIEQDQRQRLIINRNKINEILASSVSNFRKPEPHKHKFKSTSYITKRPQQKAESQGDTSFIAEFQSPHHPPMPNSRKIIKSNNFSKLNNIKSAAEIPSSSSKNTIEDMRQRAFLLEKQMEQNIPSPVTFILKVVKKYLQVIAEGKIDDIESFLSTTGETYTNINELINRKKLFKTALYFERASIVAGICYGYLMITQERGYLSYQMGSIDAIKPKQQASRQSAQTLKQHTKQVLKYMINLASFSLNNCKLIAKTIEDHLLVKSADSLTDSETRPKSKPPQHQLIEKQIYKRNVETVKLNIQYTQETLHKLFGETVGQRLAVDEDFGESFKNVSRLVQKHSMQESFYTLLEYFAFYLSLIKRQHSIPFLAVAPNPYLDAPEKYTLVIDFISVFCYGTKKSKTFVFRPYSQHFLWQMSQYFDIVVISDALPQQIDKIIDLLDTKGVIRHRLYKYHMAEEKMTGRYMKSLERIGRDLDKMVLLDVEGNRITEEASNTIFISEWRGSKNDSVLAELCSVLLAIVVNRLDCSKATAKIQTQMKLNLAQGIRHINFGLDLKEETSDEKGQLIQVHEKPSELVNE